MNKQLSARERAFAAHYVALHEAKAAAIAAGVSAKNAKVEGYRMLRRPRVRVEIVRLNKLAIANADEVAKAKRPPTLDKTTTNDPTTAAANATLKRAAYLALLIDTAEIASGKKAAPFTIMPRREGDEPITVQVRNTNLGALLKAAKLIGKELDFQEALERSAAANEKSAAVAKRVRAAMDKQNGAPPGPSQAAAAAAKGNPATSPASKAAIGAKGGPVRTAVQGAATARASVDSPGAGKDGGSAGDDAPGVSAKGKDATAATGKVATPASTNAPAGATAPSQSRTPAPKRSGGKWAELPAGRRYQFPKRGTLLVKER